MLEGYSTNFGSRILVVAAHPDDESIGAGGTIARLCAEKKSVRIVFLSDGESSRFSELADDSLELRIISRRNAALRAANILGAEIVEFHGLPDNSLDIIPLLDLVQLVETHISDFKPQTVITHSHSDLNVDHELALRAVLTAARPTFGHSVNAVLSFETLSSSNLGFVSRPRFEPSLFIDITPHLGTKVSALREYSSEIPLKGHARSIEAIERNAKHWGDYSGRTSVEAFEIQRLVF